MTEKCAVEKCREAGERDTVRKGLVLLEAQIDQLDRLAVAILRALGRDDACGEPKACEEFDSTETVAWIIEFQGCLMQGFTRLNYRLSEIQREVNQL